MLHGTGYDLVEADDGLTPYDLIRARHGALDLLVTDMRMPHMNGAELIHRVEREYPKLKILCISGYADPMSPSGHYFLAKPFTRTALRAMIEKVMGVSDSAPVSDGQAVTKSDERRRMHSDLHVRLVAAEAKLEAADLEYRRLAAGCADVVDNSPDSHLALQHAVELKKNARDEYSKALQDWTDFHLDVNGTLS
jgi:YesN/AraC family two-component response regulator